MTSKQTDSSKGDILIVDDDLPSLNTLSSMLTTEGYDVRGPCRLPGNWTRLVLALLTISCLLLFPLRSHADGNRNLIQGQFQGCKSLPLSGINYSPTI